ncbi:type II toxin-antitoxin system RelE/ParE family toxin [Pseudenhygromyxa sp. WMMC2535]|uniref:type II toxin-antitoxin system RelE/ParE family toxin n=1 Tax=Pseudenhygromyxa sp. WMMC2535 TaxID=2712867 RepID=UPI00155402CD|nr:type II toxin-antitoxin system RelE/ParE family toxin [Pseudenhygromyxa sp. WMMC2535]NVB36389.1 type II toxin-antitoxin system RelE/ParE family toxin [Pseudenhygromyxa sp. WMMC2535]
MRLPFQADAAEELEEAAAWYERERRGYGALFVAEVQRAVDRAVELPQSGPRVPGTPPSRDVRRFVVRRFPYTVVTAMLAGQQAVVAVAHGRRRPGYWRDRLK